MRRKLVAGNWKMHGRVADFSELDLLITAAADCPAEILLCVPAPLVASFAQHARGTAVVIGAQDCHAEPAGAHTGDVSAEMLADAGAQLVIVGHSERRTAHAETNAIVCAKAAAAWRAGLRAIICVGESAAERESGQAEAVVGAQIAGSVPEGATAASTVIAYEPVWAIGSGRIPTDPEIARMHGHIRSRLGGNGISLLYGGSVTAANAAQIFAVEDVDGALVGGASLTADKFTPIMAAAG